MEGGQASKAWEIKIKINEASVYSGKLNDAAEWQLNSVTSLKIGKEFNTPIKDMFASTANKQFPIFES